MVCVLTAEYGQMPNWDVSRHNMKERYFRKVFPFALNMLESEHVSSYGQTSWHNLQVVLTKI